MSVALDRADPFDTASAVGSGPRPTVFELLKLPCMLGVTIAAAVGGIWPGGWGLSGLFVFLFFAGYLSDLPPGGMRRFAADRLALLGPPWLFWVAVCGAVSAASAHAGGADGPQGALADAALHLWLPPYALCGGLLAAGLRAAAIDRLPSAAHAALVFAVCLSVFLGLAPIVELPAPYNLWLLGAPALLGGLHAASAGRSDGPRGAAAVALAGAAGSGCAALLGGEPVAAWTAVAALVCAAAVLPLPRRAMRLSGAGALALGVYLIHPLALTALRDAAPGLGPLGLGLGAFSLALLAAAALRRLPVARRLV